MLVWPYFIVYVEVPSGHPGVDCVLGEDIPDAIERFNKNRSAAIIAITKGNCAKGG